MSTTHHAKKDLQDRAARVRYHAQHMTSGSDRDNLLAYAEELEVRAAALRTEDVAD